MEAYLFCEKPNLCNTPKCQASGNIYFKNFLPEKNNHKTGGFYKCQVCGTLHIHIRAYQNKTLNQEIIPLTPNDEKQLMCEYILRREEKRFKRYEIKEQKKIKHKEKLKKKKQTEVTTHLFQTKNIAQTQTEFISARIPQKDYPVKENNISDAYAYIDKNGLWVLCGNIETK